jgi:hypothetical protein
MEGAGLFWMTEGWHLLNLKVNGLQVTRESFLSIRTAADGFVSAACSLVCSTPC